MGTTGSGFEEKLNYVTLPLNINWHFGSTRKWYLNFGPSIGFLTSAKFNSTDVKSFANTNQFGFNYGIGYKIEVSENFSFSIDSQNMVGLTDITKNPEIKLSNATSAFNVGGVFKF